MNKQTFLALLLTTALSAPAQGIEIVSPVDTPAQVRVKVQSVYDFGKTLSLKVKRDTSLIPHDRLIAMVRKIDFRDGAGVAIKTGWDMNKQHDLVIGYSGGTAEIIKAHKTAKGVKIIASFKNNQGQFVAPPVSQIGLMNTSGDPLCYDYEDVQVAATPMHFTLLLDRSGSMEDYMAEVIRAAYAFIRILPDHATCSVASFSDNTLWHHPGPGLSCRPQNFVLSHIEPYGGTDIYTPLLDTYRAMEQRGLIQKAVIIITDGVISENHLDAGATTASLLKHKQDTLTFVYWLGEDDERFLKALADSYIRHQGSIRYSLERYFNLLGGAYAMQRVLTVHSCAKGVQHGKP